MQAVKLITEPQALVGTSIVVKTTFNLPENTKIYWAGNRIYAKRLCGRDIVLSKVDIFCEGQLEKGEYIREKSLPLSTRVPPTVKERNLNYVIRSEISMIKPGTHSEEEYFFAENPIILKAGPKRTEEPQPVDVSMTGIKIHMDTDHFHPGETIRMDYKLEKFKDLEVDLVKNANITCNCPDYAPTCIHIKPKPPSVETSVKAKNLTSGSLQLILPSYIETTHRYVWEPPEKMRWKETYGDYVNWLLEVIGTHSSGEIVKFQIPINIIGKKTPENDELFSIKQVEAPLRKKILVPDSFQIDTYTLDEKQLILSIKNNSKEILRGVTVKIIPIESEFFELPPRLTGVNKWNPNTGIKAYHNNIGKNIKNIQILIEDNQGIAINKRLNL